MARASLACVHPRDLRHLLEGDSAIRLPRRVGDGGRRGREDALEGERSTGAEVAAAAGIDGARINRWPQAGTRIARWRRGSSPAA